MLEKLIESWLDSASEKTYQPIFCQMLAKQGYTVIHSTRHGPIEYGKDIIAIHADGTPCAFQLKGNPGIRLTLAQYRNIVPQLRELVNQQIEHPAVPKTSHRSFLVTNGEIEEEVQQAIEQENAANKRDGYPQRILETISRGQLFSWACGLDASLWPSEIKETKAILDMITHIGNECLPLQKLHELLQELLCLKPEHPSLSINEFQRRSSSAALLTAVCLTPFSRQSNHWATITAWTCFAVYLIGSAEKSNIPEKAIKDALALSKDIIFNEIIEFMKEVLYRETPLGEGNLLPDFAVYPWRYTLIVGLASLTWLWLQHEDSWPDDDFENKLTSSIPDKQQRLDLWGDAAFPQFLFQIWQMEANGMSEQANQALEDLLTTSINSPLPSIYCDIETVLEHKLSDVLEAFNPQFDLRHGHSWIVRQLMLHMAQKDMKSICQKIWPSYSRVVASVFLPEPTWAYCLFRSELGNNMQYVPKTPESWENLKKEAAEEPKIYAPEQLLMRPWLLGMWVVICPYRAIPAIVNYLYVALTSQSSKEETALEAVK